MLLANSNLDTLLTIQDVQSMDVMWRSSRSWQEYSSDRVRTSGAEKEEALGSTVQDDDNSQAGIFPLYMRS